VKYRSLCRHIKVLSTASRDRPTSWPFSSIYLRLRILELHLSIRWQLPCHDVAHSCQVHLFYLCPRRYVYPERQRTPLRRIKVWDNEVLEGQEVRTTGGRADCLYEKQTKERVGEGAGGDRRNGFWVLEGFFDSVLLCVRSRKLHLS
jgi:hypothetical protein